MAMNYDGSWYNLRVPVFPFEKIQYLNTLFTRYHEDKDTLIEIKRVFSDTLFIEAVYISSVELYHETQKWLSGTVKNEKDELKLLNSLYRYYIRMCTRATPFGLFAGYSNGRFSDTDSIVISHEKLVRHVRLDSQYLAALVSYLVEAYQLADHLVFYKNNTIYKAAGEYRYIETEDISHVINYKTSVVEKHDTLEFILEAAAQGRTIAQLATLLCDDDITYEDARNFVHSLIAAQLLTSEFNLNVTGLDYLTYVTGRVKEISSTIGHPQLTDLCAVLEELSTQLQHADSIAAYENIVHLLKKIKADTSSKKLLQIDTSIPCSENHLKKERITALNKLEILLHLNIAGDNRNLEVFKQKFQEKYGDKIMPLGEVLDEDIGIGYATDAGKAVTDQPLLENIHFRSGKRQQESISWTSFKQYKLRKYIQAIEQNSKIILTTEELEQLTKDTSYHLPDAAFIHGVIIPSAESNSSEKFLLLNYGGASSVSIISRFSHREKDAQLIAESIREEQSHYPDAIFAEIVHLPQIRTANILTKPDFRGYEIPYLCKSLLPVAQQIPLDEISVFVREDEIFLWSKRLNKRIFPKLTSAHFYLNSELTVYKFLCELQSQKSSQGFVWDWDILQEQPFLPRVEYEDVIVSRATWNLKKDNITDMASDACRNVDSFKNCLHQLHIPRHCAVVEDDNELYIDLHVPMGVDIVLQKLNKYGAVKIVEFLLAADGLLVRNKAGEAFCHEVAFPLNRINKKEGDIAVVLKTNDVTDMDETAPESTFLVGSEWLYVKIYCGIAMAEKLLHTVVKPFVEDQYRLGRIEKFFFIRYNDPDHHIRLRFHNAGHPELLMHVLTDWSKVSEEWIKAGVIANIQVDTYKREIERYGKQTITFCEELFAIDSLVVLEALAVINEHPDAHSRWLFAAMYVNALLDVFKVDLAERVRMLGHIRNSFFKEFGGEASLTHQLNDSYRKKYGLLKAYFSGGSMGEMYDFFAAIVKDRIEKMEGVATAINAKAAGDPALFISIVSGLIHMFINRVFTSQQRKNELVIYHFLHKYHQSVLSLAKRAVV